MICDISVVGFIIGYIYIVIDFIVIIDEKYMVLKYINIYIYYKII